MDRHASFWLRELDPIRSLDEIRAEVIEIIEETADVKTFVLRPNARWQHDRAGQFTAVEVEIDGVRTRRCYTISSSPGASRPTITVKRTIGGRVSNWLHDHARPGDVLALSPASGDFVLPEPPPQKLLLVSGGSGITPVMSMLRDLDRRDAVGDVVFVHYARSSRDVIFAEELREIAARHPRLRVHIRLDDAASPGLFSEDEVRRLVPDFTERDTFLCGPPGLMERVEQLWKSHGIADRLRRERFVSAIVASANVEGGIRSQITLVRSGRRIEAESSRMLLDELERAGERPASGCRMGICRTCRCRKRSGMVENSLTGEVSSEPDEDIQLCISRPRSDVTLEL
jgi:ferredoxin-NADP reductase